MDGSRPFRLQFETIEKNLDRALELARDCQTAYRAASAKVRRLFNQAFFTKIYVYDDGQVTHDLAEPFRTLLDARLPAELRGEHLDDSSSPDRARAERGGCPPETKRHRSAAP